MEGAREQRFDLSAEKAAGLEAAREWGLELGEPFVFSNVSYVAPAGRAVLEVAWEGDDESLHEGDALELWDSEGAVRLLRRSGRALLEERAVPGDDLSALPDDEATAIAVDVASRLWRRAGSPFRQVASEVPRWLDEAGQEGSELIPLARELLAEVDPDADWLVHGDFHHHNLLRRGERCVAIDPKPYSPIASTICLRSSGTRCSTGWRIASRRSDASRPSSRQVSTTSGSARER